MKLSSSLSDNHQFHVSSNVIFQKLDQNVVLIHTKSNRIFDLNETGAALWELLISGLSIAQARQKILEQYDANEIQLTDDIVQAVNFFIDESLLEIQNI